MKTELSVVLPIFNEESNIIELYKRVSISIKSLEIPYEIIFINDGSSDDSLKLITRIYQKDRTVKVINLSRNFGHMSAISAGLKCASGNKVVVMDSDLQDPPELIPKLFTLSNKYDVVYAKKKSRKENLLLRFGFNLFYFFQSRLTSLPIPTNAGTFSILDKKVVNSIVNLTEKNKFFSGLRVWAGYSQGSLEYDRSARVKGNRKSVLSLINFALDGIFSFSYAPLRLSSILGFCLSIVSFLLILTVVTVRLFFDIGIIGWASTLIAILFIGGIQLITLGIIGEYLARIYEEVKNRPEYLIQSKLGFNKINRKASKKPR